MQYTTTKTQTHEATLSPECSMAIMTHAKLLRLQKRVEAVESELTNYVVTMPKNDLAHYVAITDEMEK